MSRGAPSSVWRHSSRSGHYMDTLSKTCLLEEEMATHSSTLAWKIPWVEEPGELQSVGLQRVGHD